MRFGDPPARFMPMRARFFLTDRTARRSTVIPAVDVVAEPRRRIESGVGPAPRDVRKHRTRAHSRSVKQNLAARIAGPTTTAHCSRWPARTIAVQFAAHFSARSSAQFLANPGQLRSERLDFALHLLCAGSPNERSTFNALTLAPRHSRPAGHRVESRGLSAALALDPCTARSLPALHAIGRNTFATLRSSRSLAPNLPPRVRAFASLRSARFLPAHLPIRGRTFASLRSARSLPAHLPIRGRTFASLRSARLLPAHLPIRGRAFARLRSARTIRSHLRAAGCVLARLWRPRRVGRPLHRRTSVHSLGPLLAALAARHGAGAIGVILCGPFCTRRRRSVVRPQSEGGREGCQEEECAEHGALDW